MRLVFLSCILFLTSCAVIPKAPYSATEVASPPDYSDSKYWAALPEKEDNADRTPGALKNNQATAEVDVFFIHPTTYTRKKGNTLWNGPLEEPELNETTDDGTIL